MWDGDSIKWYDGIDIESKSYSNVWIKPLRKSSTSIFVHNATLIHNDIYDYSLVDYITSSSNVKIICHIHGIFYQRPNAHLKGSGCPSCSSVKKLTLKEFLEKAQNKHGNVYDYSLVNYINATTKITIICKEHGKFTQTPNSHLNGRGCMKCGLLSTRTSLTDSKSEFVEKAKNIYGEKFIYKDSIYVNALTPLIICCKLHGQFIKTPNNHLCGQSCPECSKEINPYSFVYIKKLTHIKTQEEYYKVGMTNKNSATQRHYGGMTNYGFQIDHIDEFELPTELVRSAERAILTECRGSQKTQYGIIKNVKIEGYTEIFNVDEKILEIFYFWSNYESFFN